MQLRKPVYIMCWRGEGLPPGPWGVLTKVQVSLHLPPAAQASRPPHVPHLPQGEAAIVQELSAKCWDGWSAAHLSRACCQALP